MKSFPIFAVSLFANGTTIKFSCSVSVNSPLYGHVTVAAFVTVIWPAVDIETFESIVLTLYFKFVNDLTASNLESNKRL